MQVKINFYWAEKDLTTENSLILKNNYFSNF